MSKTICLNMIVKNESHVIEATLENIIQNIPLTYYVISDTGSTDNTVELIENFFNKHNIKGEIYNDEWKDFGYNRTLALKHAFNKTDFVFIFDADDRFNGTFKMPSTSSLVKDTYYLRFGGGCLYKRLLLISNRIEWKYVGVLHEYLATIVPNLHYTTDFIEGNYYIESGKTGDRSKDPDKYKKDALILENAHNKAVEENDHIKIRYSFYCAQSYRDCNEKEKSIEWYKKRVDYGDWNQEVYFSLYQIGIQYMALGQYEKAIYYWSLSVGVDDRYECLYDIIKFFRNNKKPFLAFNYYKMIQKFDINQNDKLFLAGDVYDFLLDFEVINFAHQIRQHRIGIQSFNKLFLSKKVKHNLPLQHEILRLFLLYTDYLLETDKDLFTNYCEFVKNIYFITKGFDNNMSSIINVTVMKFCKFHNNNIDNNLLEKLNNIYKLTGVTNVSNSKQPKINVLLSITSCKRYDLFHKTINSLLYCFKDIDKIDYFFCVDDNSSTDDRKNMLKNYPFIKYYFKKDNEKGHLASMNIIWDKLNELKPKYWIHLEDDWLFFKPDDYVTKSIDFLEKNKNAKIHQILYNKGYAEIISHYDYVGGSYINGDPNYLLHIKDEQGLHGRNCAYWPHYSFRPSMILVETILKLGNYTSKDTFFERSYSDKYFEKGYKSAFFNEITSIHTGRLTSERFDKTKKNAYELNSIDQFHQNEQDGKVNNSNIQSNIDNNINHNDNINNTNAGTIRYEKLNDNYVIIRSKDHFGSDLGYKPNASLEELMLIADNDENILCFNTLGYLKDECNINTLIDFYDFSKGIIINVKRFNAKYGNVINV